VAHPNQVEALVATSGRSQARALVGFLREEQVNVIHAADADTAFEEALLHRPSVVLIDDALPPAGGIELCTRLKQSPRTCFVPAILCVPTSSREYRIRAYAAGADAIFESSTDVQERKTRLWALLRAHARWTRLDRKQRSQGAALEDRRRWIAAFIHDLQNSIGAARANFDFLTQALRSGSSAPATAELAECARDGELLFSDLARGLRIVTEFERLEAGLLTVREERIPLAEIVQDVADELRPQLAALVPAREIDVEAPRTPGPGEELVLADPRTLPLALSLLGVYLGQLRPNDRISVGAAVDGDVCRVTVEGNRAVIEAAERERLFEPYAQGGSRRAPLGHGLGLPLAKALIEMQGGRVAVEAGPGEAARFVAVLQTARAEAVVRLRP
jgi:signal transduction histidine kinase